MRTVIKQMIIIACLFFVAGRASAQNITITGSALEVGDLTVNGTLIAPTISGSITAAGITSTGSVVAATLSTTSAGGGLVGTAGIITSGGITATGGINTSGIVSSGSINAPALILSGDLTAVNIIASGALTVAGMVNAGNLSTVTSGGIDVGTGGVYTMGNLTATGSLSAGSIAVSGTLNTGNIISSGVVSATSFRASDIITARNVNQAFSTTASGGVTLTVQSPFYQEFTGASAQTVTLPNTATLSVGQSYNIINNGTATITVNTSSAALVKSLPPNSQTIVTCVSTGANTAAAWNQASTNSFITGGGAGSILTTTGAISNTETAIFSTLPFAADRILTGTVLRITLDGRCSNAGTASTGTFRVRYGTAGTTADGVFGSVAFPASPNTNVTNIPFRVVLDFTIRSVGTTAAANGFGTLLNNTTTGLSNVQLSMVLATMSTINTTTSGNMFTVTFQSSAANQSVQIFNAFAEFVNR